MFPLKIDTFSDLPLVLVVEDLFVCVLSDVGIGFHRPSPPFHLVDDV